MSALADLRILLAAPLLGALVVALAPARWSRLVGGVAAGLALLVAVALIFVEPAGLAIRAPWIPGLGLELALGLGGLALPGVLVTCAIGQVASVAADGSRGTVAGGLALQAVVLAALLARDLGLLVACHGLLAPLVAALVAAGPRPDRLRAALAVALYLSVGTGLLAVAAGALAVAQHDASGGAWSFELAALGQVLLPARAEAAIGALLGLAGALTLGLWPLHGWLVEGAAAARSGPALLMLGPLRWLGLDLLLRLWLTLTPAAAAAVAPGVAWTALLGAAYGALVARAEPDPRRALALAALVPAGLIALGVVGQHPEGVAGALGLGLALTLGGAAGLVAIAEAEGRAGPRATAVRRLGALGLLAAPGLVGCVGAALVVIGTARFAGLTLAGHAPWLALAAGAALTLSLRALSLRTGREGQVPSDRSDVPRAGLLRLALVLAPVAAAGLWPGPWLARVDPVGRAAIDAAALKRCLTRTREVAAPQRAPADAPDACVQPLRALERLQGGAP